MNAPEQHRDFCPRCGVAYEPLQEYCLECGERLPVNRGVVGVLASTWQRRIAWYPGDWIWPVALFLLLTILATGAVLIANATRTTSTRVATATTKVALGPGQTQGTVPVVTTSTLPNAPQPTITTGPLPTAPGSATGKVPTTPAPNPNALAVWPAGTSGYTDVLESLPVAGGRANAVARARRAKQNGLKTVGVLVSSQYASLHPGYYVVFAGVFQTQAEASAALAAAHAKGFPDAYQTRVTH
jgi:SPOR domain